MNLLKRRPKCIKELIFFITDDNLDGSEIQKLKYPFVTKDIFSYANKSFCDIFFDI